MSCRVPSRRLKECRDTCDLCHARFRPEDDVEIVFTGTWRSGKLANVADTLFRHRSCFVPSATGGIAASAALD